MQKLIEEVYPNIYKLSLDIPVPLKAINIYFIKGQDGWSIVDCGFHNQQSEKTWYKVFEELRIDYNDISKIIVTHFHPDHYGAAGWLQEITGAPVLLLDKEKNTIERNWLDKSYPSKLKQFFMEYGMPEKAVLDIDNHYNSSYLNITPHPKDITLLSNGDEIQLGDYRFKTIWSPGHTEGLMTFWCEKEAVFISNDLVLPEITPNISYLANSAVNPLSDFFFSLRSVRNLPAAITLPGHRQLITNLDKRVDEIIDHHGHRLELVKNILMNKQEGTNNGISALDISMELFGPLPESIIVRFAFPETLSHLEYLVQNGEIKKLYVNNKYYYYK